MSTQYEYGKSKIVEFEFFDTNIFSDKKNINLMSNVILLLLKLMLQYID